MNDGGNLGAGDLQRRILAEFPIAAHMGVTVEAADADGIALRAPLAPNANHQGTAFGGSLLSLAALAGWGWMVRHLAERGLAADAVIQQSHMDYLVPVRGELRVALPAPAPAEVLRFGRMLARAGRGRICLEAVVYDGPVVAARFQGVYAAALRRA